MQKVSQQPLESREKLENIRIKTLTQITCTSIKMATLRQAVRRFSSYVEHVRAHEEAADGKCTVFILP